MAASLTLGSVLPVVGVSADAFILSSTVLQASVCFHSFSSSYFLFLAEFCIRYMRASVFASTPVFVQPLSRLGNPATREQTVIMQPNSVPYCNERAFPNRGGYEIDPLLTKW